MITRRKKRSEAPKAKISRESFREAIKTFRFIRPYRWHFFGGLALLFISSSVFMVFPYLIGLLVDIAQGNSEGHFSLRDIGIFLIIILILQGVVSYARVMLFATVSEKGIADLRKALYKKMVSLPITFFEENKSGDLISRITADVGSLYSVFSTTLAGFVRQSLTLVGGILFLFITTPRLSIIMILIIPVVMVSAILFGRYIRKFSKKRQEKLAEANSILGEALQGIQMVKAFVTELFEVKKYGTAISEVVKVAMKYAQSRAIFSVYMITILFGALLFIIWQGGRYGPGRDYFCWNANFFCELYLYYCWGNC